MFEPTPLAIFLVVLISVAYVSLLLAVGYYTTPKSKRWPWPRLIAAKVQSFGLSAYYRILIELQQNDYQMKTFRESDCFRPDSIEYQSHEFTKAWAGLKCEILNQLFFLNLTEHKK